MFREAPTAKDVKTQYAIEFGPASPRLRLTIVDLLVTNGAVHEDAVALSKNILGWITEDSEAFLEVIDTQMPDKEQADAKPDEQLPLEEDVKDGYTYL